MSILTAGAQVEAAWVMGSAFLGSWILSGRVRQHAFKNKALMDVPNARSSHVSPVPRGGGVGIVLSFSLSLVILNARGLLPWNVAIALLGGGLLLAGIGWWDDHGDVAASLRLVIHFFSAAWALFWLGDGSHPGSFLSVSGFWILLIHLIGLVWMINLYNFMDGIDGISGSEGIFVAGIFGLLLMPISPALSLVSWTLAAACAGFLLWNWAPAKIFLGDVGSGFLGYSFGTLILAGTHAENRLFWPLVILLGVFMADTLVTLLRRMLRGARWYEAHRDHAFQHASQQFNSHAKVVVGVILINLFWLLPCSLLSWRYPDSALLFAVISILPLILLALHFRAGEEIPVKR